LIATNWWLIRKLSLDPVKSIIGTIEHRFSGGLALDKDGKWYRSNTTTPQYVGIPNEAIDDAWHGLLAGEDIRERLFVNKMTDAI